MLVDQLIILGVETALIYRKINKQKRKDDMSMMDKMDKKEQAVEYKHNGCNCCQAVLMVYKDELGLSDETIKKLGAAYGVGMGCMGATCGSLIGAQMVLGAEKYEGRPILSKARELFYGFEKKSGATICKDLKGIETGKVLCECDDCVRNAVEAYEEIK